MYRLDSAVYRHSLAARASSHQVEASAISAQSSSCLLQTTQQSNDTKVVNQEIQQKAFNYIMGYFY